MSKKMHFLLPLIALSVACGVSPAHAEQKRYCGLIMCAEAVRGCEVHDGKLDPIVKTTDHDLAPSMARSTARSFRKLESACGCVVGSIVRVSVPVGGDFYYFDSVSQAYSIDDKKCNQLGLN